MKKYLYLALILLIGFMPLNVFAKDGSPAMTRLNEALASEGITPNNDSYTGSGNKVRIYIFRGQGCGYCKRLLTYLNSIIDEYKDTVNIKTYEVWYDADNSALMDNAAATMGDTVGGVPYMIIGDKSFKGYSESSNNSIISQIKKVAAEENPYDVMDHLGETKTTTTTTNNNTTQTTNDDTKVASNYSNTEGAITSVGEVVAWVIGVGLTLAGIIYIIVSKYKMKDAK